MEGKNYGADKHNELFKVDDTSFRRWRRGSGKETVMVLAWPRISRDLLVLSNDTLLDNVCKFCVNISRGQRTKAGLTKLVQRNPRYTYAVLWWHGQPGINRSFSQPK